LVLTGDGSWRLNPANKAFTQRRPDLNLGEEKGTLARILPLFETCISCADKRKVPRTRQMRIAQIIEATDRVEQSHTSYLTHGLHGILTNLMDVFRPARAIRRPIVSYFHAGGRNHAFYSSSSIGPILVDDPRRETPPADLSANMVATRTAHAQERTRALGAVTRAGCDFRRGGVANIVLENTGTGPGRGLYKGLRRRLLTLMKR